MNPEESSPLKQIRTFQGDMAEALGKQKTSVVSMQQAERAKGNALNTFATPKESSGSKRLILLIIGSLVLLSLGVGGIWYAYGQYKVKTALPVVTVPTNRFIGVQSSLVIDTSTLTRDLFISMIRTEKLKPLAPSAVEELELNLKTEDFLNLLQTSTPGNLVRALDPLFMLGLLGDALSSPTGGSTHTFLLIKLDSFENAFPGMLAWEPTLTTDLLPLFATDATVQSITATSTFADITIQNKDARVLRDPNGHTVLLYSFYNNDMLIITDNEDSLRALITMLDAGQISR